MIFNAILTHCKSIVNLSVYIKDTKKGLQNYIVDQK